MSVEGKKAVVTGGSRGIGFQICKIFMESGARVLALSRDVSHLAGASSALQGLSTLQADVSLAADVERVVAWVEESWGGLDILVNNAGILLEPQDKDLMGQGDELFFETVRINVFGPYICTKRLFPLLLKSDDPRIVNVGSTSGIMSSGLRGAYGISKAALHALTISLANELGEKVSVNALSPGWVRTDMAPDGPGDPRTSAEAALHLIQRPRSVTGKLFHLKSERRWAD